LADLVLDRRKILMGLIENCVVACFVRAVMDIWVPYLRTVEQLADLVLDRRKILMGLIENCVVACFCEGGNEHLGAVRGRKCPD
jgi:hypothetical protein